MSIFRISLSCALACAYLGNGVCAGPALGRNATEAEVSAIDISIPPSGAGLPAGSGTAREGETVYSQKCASCHGEGGKGKPADTLVGGVGTLASERPVKTVNSFWPYATTLFDYIRRAMPFNAPRSLTNSEVYAVTAYILAQDKIIGSEERIDATTLPKVQMPNRAGFVDQSAVR
jgi:S-disulfanyl-L-cysteine oxidoreductase SoxD